MEQNILKREFNVVNQVRMSRINDKFEQGAPPKFPMKYVAVLQVLKTKSVTYREKHIPKTSNKIDLKHTKQEKQNKKSNTNTKNLTKKKKTIISSGEDPLWIKQRADLSDCIF